MKFEGDQPANFVLDTAALATGLFDSSQLAALKRLLERSGLFSAPKASSGVAIKNNGCVAGLSASRGLARAAVVTTFSKRYLTVLFTSSFS